MKLNEELLRRVQEHIKAQPERFGMNFYFRTPEPVHLKEPEFSKVCGSAACIAGRAVILAEEWGDFLAGQFDDTPPGVMNIAANLLGISSLQAWSLFHLSEWPEQFALRYQQATEAGNKDLAAQVACERIEHFIATEGRE